MPLTAEGAGINEIQKKLKSDGISSQNSQSINQSISLKKSKNSNAKKQQKSALKSSDEKNKQSAGDSSIFNIKENDFKKTLNVLVSSIKADNQKNSKRISQRVAEPVRISEPSSNETQETKKDYLEVTPLSEYNKYFMPTSDSFEIEARNNLAILMNNSKYFLPDDQDYANIRMGQLKDFIPKFCLYYSKYSYLCAIMKLFYAEMSSKFNNYPDSSFNPDSNNKYGKTYGYENNEMFDQIYNDYNNKIKYNDKIFEKITQISQKNYNLYPANFKDTQVKIDELLKQIAQKKEMFKEMSKPNADIVLVSENNQLYYLVNGQKIDFPNNDIFYTYEISKNYKDLIRYYGSIKKLDECEKYYNEFKEFLFGLPSKIQCVSLIKDGIKYETTPIILKISISSKSFFDNSREYMEWLARYGEISKNSDEIYNKIQNLIKDVQTYKYDQERDSLDGYNQQNIENMKKQFVNLDYSSFSPETNYYMHKPQITQMQFFKGETGIIDTNEVIDNKETITLRAVTKDLGPLYPIKNVKIKSQISNVEISFNLKRDFVLGDYYCSFVPSDTKDESGNTFIKKIEEPSIAIAVCEDTYFDKFDSIYTNEVFFKQMGYSTHKNGMNKSKLLNFETNQSFLKSGGMEKAICNYLKITQEIYIKNQAKWFLIYGHGRFSDGSVGEQNDLPNPAIIVPSKEIKSFYVDSSDTFEFNNEDSEIEHHKKFYKVNYDVGALIKENGVSEYSDNMDLLILSACETLATPLNVKNWKQVLPGDNKLILGYTAKITPNGVSEVLRSISKKITGEITLEKMANLWQIENEKIFYSYVIRNSKTNYWAYIYNDEFTYSHNAPVAGFWGYFCADRPAYTVSFKISDIDEIFKENNNMEKCFNR
ncbi:MAG: hypothetical protein QMC67_15620 [Candidatus Wallbacteria bacterium]